MTGRRNHVALYGLLLVALLLSGCSRSPSFDIMGSFFPAWLLCVAVGILLTVVLRLLLLRLRIAVAFPGLTYPCLTALCTFALWLTFFR
jgi:hypothetical protein